MIVAIDAASAHLSVALLDDDAEPIAADAWDSAQRQSAELLPRLLGLITASGRRLDETRLVAVGTGPGSFTGLRVAMALAKGLAVSLDCPIVGVPSLTAWLESEPDAGAAVTRAGAQEGWVLTRGTEAPVAMDSAAIGAMLATQMVVTPGELAAAFGIERAVPPGRAAAAIGRIAARRLRDDGADDLADLEPLYLRRPRGLEGTQAQWP
jgi:tRNA threonylcarbamoyl adenosine modification protein YeaZ